jgi:hypothetical protein
LEVRFPDPQHSSDYLVDITWDDVEKLIGEFAALKEPKAVALEHAKLLAAAVRRAGWAPVASQVKSGSVRRWQEEGPP